MYSFLTVITVFEMLTWKQNVTLNGNIFYFIEYFNILVDGMGEELEVILGVGGKLRVIKWGECREKKWEKIEAEKQRAKMVMIPEGANFLMSDN